MNLSLLLIMSFVIALCYWLEEHTRWITHISGVLLIIIIASMLGNAGLVPSTDEAYSIQFKWIMPLGIILMLLAFNPNHIKKLNKDFLVCFSIGAVATAIGGIIAGLIFRHLLPEDYWRISGQLTASFVGGYENAVSVGTALNTPTDVFLRVFAGDSALTALWIMVNIIQGRKIDSSKKNSTNTNNKFKIDGFSSSLDIASVAIALTTALTVLVLSLYVYKHFPWIPSILWASMMATLLTFTPLRHHFSGSYIFGSFILSYFIFACGAVSNIAHLFNSALVLLIFPVTIVAIHATLLFGAAKVLKIKKEIVIIASQV